MVFVCIQVYPSIPVSFCHSWCVILSHLIFIDIPMILIFRVDGNNGVFLPSFDVFCQFCFCLFQSIIRGRITSGKSKVFCSGCRVVSIGNF